MGTADQTPLIRDLRQTPQQELSEAPRLFDLTKHGFDHLLPEPIATAMPGAFQANRHRVDSRPRGGRARASGRGRAVLLPRGDVASHVVPSQRREVVFGTIPCIRRQLSRLSACVGFDLRPHRRELVRVARLVRQPLRHDHLMRRIDGRLGVYAWMNPLRAFIMRLFGSVK
jgi:hypothetical protein